MGLDAAVEVPAGRRHIIRRPRLTRLLDESGARIILLIAPAGYGKTTLAREWLEEKQYAWYRGGPASADVAALAVGLAEAAAEILPDADKRIRERLRATNQPEQETDLLAEMLAEDLLEWPADALLVFDDYQFAIDSRSSERFVRRVIEQAPVRTLLTSRRRPSWASARRILYGEMFELDREALAMNDDEAERVLARSHEEARTLLHQAQGWPAVIGLAALTEAGIPQDDLPAPLYEYFAEELYQAADPAVRWGLCQLALSPLISSDLSDLLFGPDAGESVITHGVRTGVLTPTRHDAFEIHPLLRSFLLAKFPSEQRAHKEDVLSTLFQFLLDANRWDEAFELVERTASGEQLGQLLREATHELIANGRLATIERWVAFAGEQRVDDPFVDLAESEVALCRGNYVEAIALAQRAGDRIADPTWKARCLNRAGQSALLASREADALAFHRHAAQLVPRKSTQHREALIGQFNAALDLELDDVAAILKELEELRDRTPTTLLRVGSARLLLATRLGGLDEVVAQAQLIRPMVRRSDDPLARTSFLNLLSRGLAHTARYAEAKELAIEGLAEAERYRLQFAASHFLIARAEAEAGLHRYSRALNFARQAISAATEISDQYSLKNAQALYTRVLISLGKASTVGAPNLETDVLPSLWAEYLATHALAYACAGKSADARQALGQIEGVTRTVETKTLRSCTLAILALQDGSDDQQDLALDAFRTASTAGCVDYFICAYRGCPALLRAVADTEWASHAVLSLVTRLGDHESLRMSSAGELPLSEILSRREGEVLQQLTQGRTNKEIAAHFFISESTVKVHVRRILAKMGVRSRTEAVLQAMQSHRDPSDN